MARISALIGLLLGCVLASTEAVKLDGAEKLFRAMDSNFDPTKLRALVDSGAVAVNGTLPTEVSPTLGTFITFKKF